MNDSIYNCESCRSKDYDVFCCNLCGRLVCKDCKVDIFCEGGNRVLVNSIQCGYPCYKCAAFVLGINKISNHITNLNQVPRLERLHLESLEPEFLEAMMFCYASRSQIKALREIGGIIEFLDSIEDLTDFNMLYYQENWKILLISRSADVERVINYYVSYGSPNLPAQKVNPRQIHCSSALQLEVHHHSSHFYLPILSIPISKKISGIIPTHEVCDIGTPIRPTQATTKRSFKRRFSGSMRKVTNWPMEQKK